MTTTKLYTGWGKNMREQFEQQLDLNPANFQLRAIYADWLEEQGDEAAAYCQRWMVKYKKRPLSIVDWWWIWAKHDPTWRNRYYALPENIALKLKRRYFPTRILAEQDLCQALARIKEANHAAKV